MCSTHYQRWKAHGDPEICKVENYGGGTLHASGYRRLLIDGRRVFEHVYAWEQSNGAVPDGHIVHHIDEDKLNNAIDNLELMKRADHSRYHALRQWSKS